MKVAGIDSSTQSVKLVIRDVNSGELLSAASRPHPDGTEIDPSHWWRALNEAIAGVGGIDQCDAVSIAGQQHGMVLLGESGEVLRPALLWNDTRSASQANNLNDEFSDIHIRTGSKLVASFTASKLRWVLENEPEIAKQVRAIALPHDWLSWKLSGSTDLSDLFTDRSDASGTGYFNSQNNQYDYEILEAAIGHRDVFLPKIIGANEFGFNNGGLRIAAGAGDNAAGALGVGAKKGDLVVSLGTSGAVYAISSHSTHDTSGEIAGFADATGNYLPLACTLNAGKILESTRKMLGISYEELSSLALSAKPGADGLMMIPHFDGERTPNRPDARGAILGINHKNFKAENICRAAIEGILAGVAYAAAGIEEFDIPVNRILLIGGASRNTAVQQIATEIFEKDIHIPGEGEYVANGAAKQAAWALIGGEMPVQWALEEIKVIPHRDHAVGLRERYFEAIRSV